MIEIGEDSECLRVFGRTVRCFYDRNLLLESSSCSLASFDLVEEKKVDEDQTKSGAEVLAALDRISAICSLVASIDTVRNEDQVTLITTLRKEHQLAAEIQHDLLEQCGLLDVERFTIELPKK